MNGEGFPKNIRPPAVDSPELEPPTVVHRADIKETVVFPKGGGRTKFLLTEENARCKYINMGLFFAAPGQGSQWHTHPEEAEEEEYLYIVRGKGTLYYKQDGKDHEIQFKEGEAIFTGHLTHYVKNTGPGELEIYFSIAPLPVRTIIYGVKNDKGSGFVDSTRLKPPQLVRPGDVEISYFTKGGLANRRLLHPEVVGARHGRFGTAWEVQGTGSTWHTHPIEIGEEDLFYAISGKGTMVYLQGGKLHSFEFKAGDAIHSHHLTNYTKNTNPEVLQMVYSGAPHPAGTIAHEF
jgi:oxalate decarboxylase/phosphoglucose isomerase-like protein (cupin superfamily)